MKLAVVGSRDWQDVDFIKGVLDAALRRDSGIEIISGGARGVDTIAEEWARSREVPVTVFPADWNRYGRSAGYRRNVDIVNAADVVYAFQRNKSPGTQHSIDLARKSNKPVRVWEETA